MTSNLENLKAIKNKICILHYSSSNIEDYPVKISSITLSKYDQADSMTYSIVSKTKK